MLVELKAETFVDRSLVDAGLMLPGEDARLEAIDTRLFKTLTGTNITKLKTIYYG